MGRKVSTARSNIINVRRNNVAESLSATDEACRFSFPSIETYGRDVSRLSTRNCPPPRARRSAVDFNPRDNSVASKNPLIYVKTRKGAISLLPR